MILRTVKGRDILIDAEDLDRVSGRVWSVSVWGYATRQEHGKTMYLHRVVMNAPDDLEVDHINHNRLDCRKENLRLATCQQNRRNMSRPSHNTSGFKGVCFHKRYG